MRAGTEKRGLMKDNRGATIVIVLVAMTFVAILAAVLLYMSLVNIQMKKTDREGKRNFYDAEAVMNEIRAGMQEAASFAISEAYTDYLINFNTNFAVEEQNEAEAKAERFLTIFNSALKGYEHEGEKLFTVSGETAQYNTATLEKFLTNTDGADVFGNITGDAAHGTVTSATSGVTLHGIKVTYTKDGYETAIQTDIKIAVPSLEETASMRMTQVTLPEFALIANKSLIAQSFAVSGSVYADTVDFSGRYNTFSISNAEYFIAKNNVAVKTGTANFTGSNIWATGINILNGGTFNFGSADAAGDLNVYNDLQLSGIGSKAELYGRYFGFGYDMNNADHSSSIIINGRQTILKLAGLKALTLAGHSFINVTGDHDILMGESVSVKPDQLAYLVPAECLKGVTNPTLITTALTDEQLKKDYIDLNVKIIGDKTLGQYTDDFTFVRQPQTEGTLVYFYMKFDNGTENDIETSKAANLYFMDYFEAHKEDIAKYLKLYAEEISIRPNGNSIAGNAVTYSEQTLNLIKATMTSPAVMDTLKARYDKLCVTLSPSISPDDNSGSPYEYYIDDAEVQALGASPTVFDVAGVPKAVVVKGDYEIPKNIDSSINLIIASGNVTVKENFTGLIFAGGNISVVPNVTVKAEKAAVYTALEALINPETPENDYKFFKPEHFWPSNPGGDSNTTNYGRWDMENLVTYENWTKN